MSKFRSLFPNAWFIARKEYRGSVRGRSFLIGTIFLAALGFLGTQAPALIDFLGGSKGSTITVYAKTNDLPPNALATLNAGMNSITGNPQAKDFVATGFTGSYSDALKALRDKSIDSLLVVDRDPATKDLTFLYRTDSPSDSRPTSAVRAGASALAMADWAARAGITPQQASSLASILGGRVSFDVAAARANGASESTTVVEAVAPTNTGEEVAKTLLGTALIVLIFMAIISYGTWIAMSVAEEKGSRVMELMLNATTPLQMLAGKVLGVGAAGLTQYGLIMLAFVAGLLLQAPIREHVFNLPPADSPFEGLSLQIFGAFIILFLLGFFLHSLLYAALGSLVSRQEDIQQATGPLMIIVMIGYFLSVFALQAINETWVQIASFIPFFAPYLMLARLLVGHVEAWEFILSCVLMFATAIVAIFVAARIYSAGVLLYGQRVSLRKVLSAARVAR